jgi:predicted tellurium resistance membrane protein TerC
LLILGLAISIPLIIFGSTAILKLMDRFPGIIKLGAGLLGYVAGEMLLGEPILQEYMYSPIARATIPWVCAALVLSFGAWMAKKSDAQ